MTSVMHFAHSAGTCGAAVAKKSSTFLTTGSDAVVRLHDINTPESGEPWWMKDDAEEPEPLELSISEIHEKPINAVAVAPDESTLATACDDGYVRLFSFSVSRDGAELKEEGSLLACTRFAGPVRALSFSPTGAFLAAAGDEPGLIKLIMTAQPANVSILRGSNSSGTEAMRTLQFDPLSDFVASIGERGSACIWSVENGAFVTAIELNDRNAKSLAWAHDGESLVIGTDKGAVIVSRESWTVDRMLTDAGDGDDDDDDGMGATGRSDITAVAWSTSNQYLLTGCSNSRVSIWDLSKRSVLKTWKSEAPVQHVLWHSSHNSFILVDEIGQFGIVSDVIPKHLPKSSSNEKEVALPTIEADSVLKTTKPSKPDGKSKSRKADKGKKKTDEKDDENKVDEEEVNDAESGSGPSGEEEEGDNRFQFAFDAEELEADDEEELQRGGIISDTDNSEPEEDRKDMSVEVRSKKRRSRRRAPRGPPKVFYTPFVPSATPANESTVQKMRLLHWNLVGAVISYSETTHSVVEVEFADSARRSVRIKDHFGYSIGCVSEAGVLLGASKTKDHASLVYFRPFSSWSANSEWTQFLLDDGNATVLALGSSFAAVGFAPSKTVRIFSLSGIQSDVFSIPGPILSMTAYNDQLAVVYCVPGSALLRYELYKISDEGEVSNTICRGEVVVSEGSKIEWLGFAQSGELAIYDSSGTMFLLSGRYSTKRWVPMLRNAATLAKCDWFWPVAINSKSVIGVTCHSNERYPIAKPRAPLRSVPLVAPVLQPKAKSGKQSVEERFFQCKLELDRIQNEKDELLDRLDSDDDELGEVDERMYRAEAQLDKCTLALMQEACKNEQNLRAFDYATRLHSKVSFKYALELAKYFKRNALAARVEQVAALKLAEREVTESREPGAKKRRRRETSRPIDMSKLNFGGDEYKENGLADDHKEDDTEEQSMKDAAESKKRKLANASDMPKTPKRAPFVNRFRK